MSLVDDLRMELEKETATTRRVLDRVKDDKMSWQPHEKSMTLQQLSSHVADVLSWTKTIAEQDEFSLEGEYNPWMGNSRSEMLEHFDASVEEALAVLTGKDDIHMRSNWRMRMGGQVIHEAPRIETLRAFILNHMIHHRGQLSVYLRMTGSLVPAIYGPSADES